MQSFGRLSFDTINAVSQVLTLRNLSQAADRIGITQSGVSFHVSRFEKSMGMRLLVRSGNNLVPTPAAERLLPICNRIVSDWERMARISEDRELFKRALGLSSDVFAYMQQTHNEVLTELGRDFRLIIADPDNLKTLFDRGEIDLWAAPTATAEETSDFKKPLEFVWAKGLLRQPEEQGHDGAQILGGPRGSFQATLNARFFDELNRDYNVVAEALSFSDITALLSKMDCYCLVPSFAAGANAMGLARPDRRVAPGMFSKTVGCFFSCRYRREVFSNREAEAVFEKLCLNIGLDNPGHEQDQAAAELGEKVN